MVWFRDYKLPDGKPASAFGYGGAPLGAAMASRVISDTHALYQARARRQAPGCRSHTTRRMKCVEVGGAHVNVCPACALAWKACVDSGLVNTILTWWQ